MSEIASEFIPKSTTVGDDAKPELFGVPTDDIQITHSALRHILDHRNRSTPRSRLVELMRFTFMANGQPGKLYTPPTDYMVDTFRTLPAWVGVEGSPHGPGNYHRIEKLHSDKHALKYLDEDLAEANVDYEWVENAKLALSFDKLSRELLFGVLAVKLVALEDQDSYWKNF